MYLTSLAANRSLSRILCFVLLFAFLASPCAPMLQDAKAQGRPSKEKSQITVPPGSKLGPGLPDLAYFRHLNVAQPHAPASISAAHPCFDCEKTSALSSAFSAARLDPSNRTGQHEVDLLSQNFNWSKPLVSLKGRAGLDLNLALVYNSLVWTKAGQQIAFDADRGQPSPGFRLGFPTIQPRYRDKQTGKYTYLLITPEGSRVELRQSGETNIYEATDNSLLQMIDHGASGALVRRSDGTQLSFKWVGGQLQATEVKDRNGNYITASYDERGHLSGVTDTLGRTFLFNRDRGGNLLSITQARKGQDDRVLATFGYSDLAVQTNFSNLKVIGPSNGSTITVLTQVGLPDGSRSQFDYTSWGQVWRITNYAPDNHALTYISYNVPQDAGAALADCPRPTELRKWIEGSNNESEAVTRFDFDQQGGWGQATLPDGSIHKEIFATEGWQRGLTVQTEDSAGGALQRRTTTEWTQDNTSLNYQLNPRQQEVNTYYSNGNRQRTRKEYTTYGLLSELYRYASDETTPIQHTHLEYNFDTAYISRRILGLEREQAIYGAEGTLISKTSYDYDLNGVIDQGSAVQHDHTNYGSELQKGRGLVCAVQNWKSSDNSKTVTSYTGYNTTGSTVFKRDSEGHQTNFDYTDNFAGSPGRKALAFATTTTDSKGSISTQYDFDTGAKVWTQDAHGTINTFIYDSAGRAIGRTNQTTGTSSRTIYDERGTLAARFIRMRPNLKELGSYIINDGVGRLRARAKDPLSIASGYKGIYITRDAMGRTVSETKPTKMTATWAADKPVAVLNPTGLPERKKDAQSLMASIVQFGERLFASFDAAIGAVQPTTQAQTCTENEYYPCGDGSGTYVDMGDYFSYVGNYDGVYSPDLGATWNAVGGYWDFGGDQSPVQITSESAFDWGDSLMIAGGLIMVGGGPEDPFGDVAAAGYLTYEWIVVGAVATTIVAAAIAYPPVPWDNPARAPGPGWVWKGNGDPGTVRGSWVDEGTGESLHPDIFGDGNGHGPHWDWVNPANNGPNNKGWRAYPDGTLEPKE